MCCFCCNIGVYGHFFQNTQIYKHLNKIILTGTMDEKRKNRVYWKKSVTSRSIQHVWSSSEISLHLYYVPMDVDLVSLPYFLPKRFRLFEFPSFSVFNFLKFPLFVVYCLSNIPYFHPRWPRFIDIYTMLTQHCVTLMQSIVSSFCNSELFSYFLAILLLTCSIVCRVFFLYFGVSHLWL